MYTIRKFHYSPDPENSGGPNFDALEEAFSDEPKVIEQKVDDDPNPDDDLKFGDEGYILKEGDEGFVAPELKFGDEGYILKEGDEGYVKPDEELAFKLPGEEGYVAPAGTTAAEGADEDSTWIGLAKEHGLEIKDDTIEAYKAALKAERETAIATAVEAVKKEQFQFDVAKYPERERLYLEHVLNGGSLEDFEKPTQAIDNYLAMDNNDLLKADFVARGFSEIMAEAEISLLSEKVITLNKGTAQETTISVLEHEGNKLRNILTSKRGEVISNAIADRNTIKEREQQILNTKIAEENTKFKEELGRTKTFYDIPVSDKQREIIAQKWESGELRKLFAEKPEMAVQAAMQYYFGKQVIQQLKTMEYDAGADRFRRKLSNVPPKTEGGSGRGQKNKQTAGGDGPNFEALQEGLGD